MASEPARDRTRSVANSALQPTTGRVGSRADAEASPKNAPTSRGRRRRARRGKSSLVPWTKAPSVDQNMPCVTLGNEALPIQQETGLFDPPKGSGQASLGPIHLRTTTQPVFFGSGAWGRPHDCQERTSWTQPASNSREDTRLLGNGQVDQR